MENKENNVFHTPLKMKFRNIYIYIYIYMYIHKLNGVNSDNSGVIDPCTEREKGRVKLKKLHIMDLIEFLM